MDSLKIGISIVMAAVILAVGLANIITPERSVSVRGLAEREVDADLAVWNMSFSMGENSLESMQKSILEKTEVIKKYLIKHGLEESDFTVKPAAITDNSLNSYMDQTKITYKFVAQQTILVRSGKIEAVKSAYADSLELVSAGIAVNQDYDSKVSYEFTKLNDIKPEMIAEATKNARTAAEQFAHDSNSKVGKIKKATQGLFTIEDAAVGLEDKKSVRVVNTVEYLLK
ncbi:MAG: SIMPL domain-containing protein [Treponema sp.]|nr:SIMPL domain-containing protein [Treponema sp.]